jgi:hypothetical protein
VLDPDCGAHFALAAGLTVWFRVTGERMAAGRRAPKLIIRTREIGVLDFLESGTFALVDTDAGTTTTSP